MIARLRLLDAAQRPVLGLGTDVAAVKLPKSGRDGYLRSPEGPEEVQPAEVGHGGSQQGLQEGLAPSPVAGLAAAIILLCHPAARPERILRAYRTKTADLLWMSDF